MYILYFFNNWTIQQKLEAVKTTSKVITYIQVTFLCFDYKISVAIFTVKTDFLNINFRLSQAISII